MQNHVSVTIRGYPGEEKAANVLVKEVKKREHHDASLDEFQLQPLLEVENLLWIKENRLYSAALDDWDRRAKLFAGRVDRKDNRCEGLKNEIYQVVGFFSVFQGVVLTAVTQMTQSDKQSSCKKVWSPVLLLGIAWVTAIVAVWQKLQRIQEIEDGRNEDDNTRKELVRRASELRRVGKKFQFKSIKEIKKGNEPTLYFGKRRSFWIYRFGPIVASLSSFTGAFVASCFLILCDRGLAPISVALGPGKA